MTEEGATTGAPVARGVTATGASVPDALSVASTGARVVLVSGARVAEEVATGAGVAEEVASVGSGVEAGVETDTGDGVVTARTLTGISSPYRVRNMSTWLIRGYSGGVKGRPG